MVYLNTTINVGAESLNFPRLRNNMLRIYVFGYQNTIKKRLINKFGDWISKTTDTVNFYLMDANCKYNSLSEEDKIIIETAISLLY
jgi:UDP-N-acetylglucosamine transferase subunit ALG13